MRLSFGPPNQALHLPAEAFSQIEGDRNEKLGIRHTWEKRGKRGHATFSASSGCPSLRYAVCLYPISIFLCDLCDLCVETTRKFRRQASTADLRPPGRQSSGENGENGDMLLFKRDFRGQASTAGLSPGAPAPLGPGFRPQVAKAALPPATAKSRRDEAGSRRLPFAVHSALCTLHFALSSPPSPLCVPSTRSLRRAQGKPLAQASP